MLVNANWKGNPEYISWCLVTDYLFIETLMFLVCSGFREAVDKDIHAVTFDTMKNKRSGYYMMCSIENKIAFQQFLKSI